MVRRRARISVLLVSITVLWLTGSMVPSAALGVEISADLDGHGLGAADINKYHCHLVDLPRVHCFRSTWARDASLERGLKVKGAQAVTSGYVTVWQDASYLGPSVSLTADISNLGSIGWNDRITSFKAFSGASGRFFEHAGYTGTQYSFCCGVQVPNVGPAYNDKFSSFDLS